jgi:hypothetical protein
MNADSGTSTRARESHLLTRPEWNVGPRTAAWDRLWRAILSDIGAIPVTDTREPLKLEGNDA